MHAFDVTATHLALAVPVVPPAITDCARSLTETAQLTIEQPLPVAGSRPPDATGENPLADQTEGSSSCGASTQAAT